MATKLYVGSLPFATTQEQLSAMFSQAGTVSSATIITDKMTGRSRGFGFVEMASDDEAAKAIEMFNGQEMEGRKLMVNEARPMQPRTDGGGGGRGFGGGGGSRRRF